MSNSIPNSYNEEIQIKNDQFEKQTPMPLPGCFYIEMIPNIPTNSHSNTLDSDYKIIHTPITEMFPIDVLSEMRNIDEDKKETWLRPGTQIDSFYYQEKSDRNELLMRDEQKHTIEDVCDYQSYLQDTFDLIYEPNEDIIEEYPLIAANKEFVIFSGDIKKGEMFRLEKGETSLVDRCVVNDLSTGEKKIFKSTKLHVEDKICIEIKEGMAHYSEIKYVYKLL